MLQFTDKEMTRGVSILAITRFFSADHKKYKRDWKVEKLDFQVACLPTPFLQSRHAKRSQSLIFL